MIEPFINTVDHHLIHVVTVCSIFDSLPVGRTNILCPSKGGGLALPSHEAGIR